MRTGYKNSPNPVLLLVFVVLTFCSMTSAQKGTTASINPPGLYELTLNYQFHSADSMIKISDQKFKNDLSYQLSVINHYWWKLVSSDNSDHFAGLIELRLKQMESIVQSDKKELENAQLFAMISAYAFSARINLHNNAWFDALAKLSKYHSVIGQSFGRENEFPAFYLTSGLYYYFTAHARDKIPVVRLFLSNYTSKDKETGLAYLVKAASSNDFLIRNEAIYFLMKIAFEIEANPSAAYIYCNSLLNATPDNLLYQYYRFKIYLSQGKLESAREQYQQILKTAGRNNGINSDEKKYFASLCEKDLKISGGKTKH
jgi:tetratricopeptide (TPR) repeat protein